MCCASLLILTLAFAPAAEPKSGGKTLSQWVEELKSPDANKRIEAADRLEGFREKALPALDALVAALKDSDPKVRALAAKALGNLNQQGRPAVKGLLDAAKTSDTKTRAAAAVALGWICEKHGGEAVEALAGLLADKEKEVRV